MTRRFTAWLTILTVATCPAICLTGGLCFGGSARTEGNQKAPPARCCCCCRHAIQEEADSGNVPLPGNDGCHCLCKGTVLDHGQQPFELMEAGWWSPATSDEVTLSVSRSSAWETVERLDDPHSTSGLCARVALCSLLR